MDGNWSWGTMRASRNSTELSIGHKKEKFRDWTQQLFHYISLFCGSGIWARLSQAVLFFHVGLTQITGWIQLAYGLVWRYRRLHSHIRNHGDGWKVRLGWNSLVRQPQGSCTSYVEDQDPRRVYPMRGIINCQVSQAQDWKLAELFSMRFIGQSSHRTTHWSSRGHKLCFLIGGLSDFQICSHHTEEERW